ncbi:unnamed protein product [Malus baccata var. baccata]
MVSTRSTVQKLIPFDPELEQNLRRKRKEQLLQRVPPLQVTFLQSLNSEDLHSKEKMAFVIPEAGLPLGDSLTAHTTNIPNCITYLAVEEMSTFEIKQHMLNILPTFHRLSSDDPNMHIAEFLMGCKNILVRGFSAESIKLRLFPYTLKDQVNAFNNFQRPQYDPYSNFYNPGWRDHPNLKWDKDQHSRPQFQQQVQQPAAPKAAWEVAIEKLANTTTQEIQNLQAAMKNMEKQIGQIALQVSERAPGIFHSQTVPNPRGREDCNVVRTLRSDSAISADSGQPQDRSENTAETTTKTAERVYEPPMPYPERLKPKAKDQQLTDFMKTLAKVQINLPLIDAIKNIPSYAKFFKDVCTKKEKLVDFEKVILTEQCSVVLLHKLPPKKKDPRSFTIACTIGNSDFKSALIDLGASVNLMPYSVFKRLGERELKPTSNIIQLADRSITYPRGIIEDVIVKVDNLYLPADFMVLDMDEDLTTPIILGRPFLATTRTLIDVEAGTLTFRVKDQTVVFRLFEASTHSGDKQECMRVDALDGLPSAKFMSKSSTDHLSIQPPNLTHDCINPKPP